MKDKNGREMKTGDVVLVRGAYFASDNGLWMVSHVPGDWNWCGTDVALLRMKKNGELSKAKGAVNFWPLKSYVNDRWKRALSDKHNKEFASVEVVDDLPVGPRKAYFEGLSAENREGAERSRWDAPGWVETYKKGEEFYAAVAASL